MELISNITPVSNSQYIGEVKTTVEDMLLRFGKPTHNNGGQIIWSLLFDTGLHVQIYLELENEQILSDLDFDDEIKFRVGAVYNSHGFLQKIRQFIDTEEVQLFGIDYIDKEGEEKTKYFHTSKERKLAIFGPDDFFEEVVDQYEITKYLYEIENKHHYSTAFDKVEIIEAK